MTISWSDARLRHCKIATPPSSVSLVTFSSRKYRIPHNITPSSFVCTTGLCPLGFLPAKYLIVIQFISPSPPNRLCVPSHSNSVSQVMSICWRRKGLHKTRNCKEGLKEAYVTHLDRNCDVGQCDRLSHFHL